jgi:hypothetical protein
MMKIIVSLLLTVVAVVPMAKAFVPFQTRPAMVVSSSSSSLQMGFFDGIMKAFGNEEVSLPVEPSYSHGR